MFIETLENLLREKGISKNKLLTDLKLNKSSILNWKQRGNIPDGKILIAIANYFNVSVEYLLGESDKKESSAEAEQSEARKRINAILDTLPEEELKALEELCLIFAENKEIHFSVSRPEKEENRK